MRNVMMALENDGKTLVIRVDLTQRLGPSSSGKTLIVASTEGNAPVPGIVDPIRVGLNVFTKH